MSCSCCLQALLEPFLLDLCFFLDSYLEILKGNINLSQKDVLQNIRSVKAKKELSSLELINEVYFDSGAFKNYKESLVEQNLIKQISLIEFRKIFTNSTITTKANWIPDQNSLYYFIKLLRQLHKIEKRSPCWPIVARCFQWQDKELSPGVAHSHVPKDEVVKNKIKKCIDFLK
jgi:hypothetical protein